MLRIVYFGNEISEYSVFFLKKLAEEAVKIELAVSSSEVSGKKIAPWMRPFYFTPGEMWRYALVRTTIGRILPGSPADDFLLSHAAKKLNIPFEKVQSINAPEVVSRIASVVPDLILVHSFSEILRKEIVEIAPLGVFNFHPGKLPAYRGPHPLEWSVLNREAEATTVCHRIEERVDTGGIVLSESVSLKGAASWGGVKTRAKESARRALKSFLERTLVGPISDTPQDLTKSHYYPRADLFKKVKARLLAATAYR